MKENTLYDTRATKSIVLSSIYHGIQFIWCLNSSKLWMGAMDWRPLQRNMWQKWGSKNYKNKNKSWKRRRKVSWLFYCNCWVQQNWMSWYYLYFIFILSLNVVFRKLTDNILKIDEYDSLDHIDRLLIILSVIISCKTLHFHPLVILLILNQENPK